MEVVVVYLSDAKMEVVVVYLCDARVEVSLESARIPRLPPSLLCFKPGNIVSE